MWGSSFIPIKNIVDLINPLSAFRLRFIITGLSLVLAHYILYSIDNRRSSKNRHYLTRKNNKNRKEVRYWKQWNLSGLFFIVGGQRLLALGAQYMLSGATALINSTIPIWVVVMALLIFKSEPAKFTIVGILAGFIGLIMLISPTINEGESSWVGIIFLILISISWAFGSLYVKPISESDNKKTILLSTGMFMSIVGIFQAILFFSKAKKSIFEVSSYH